MLYILAIVLLGVMACQPIEPSFSSEELRVVDSLYQLRKDTVELEMKERCDSIFLEVYDDMVDSLKALRKKEIMDIIGE